MNIPSTFRPLLSFALAASLVMLIILGSRISRALSLPGDLELIPKEHDVVWIARSARDVWQGIEMHFGPVIRDDSREGTLSSWFRDLDESIQRQDIELRSVEALARQGFDPDRPLLGSLQISNSGDYSAMVVVVPIVDRERFLAFTGKLTDMTAVEESVVPANQGPAIEVVNFEDDLYIAFPRPDIAVGASSLLQLERSLRNRAGNRRHFREEDLLFRSYRETWLSRSPELFFYWQKGIVPALGRGTTSVGLSDGRIVVENKFHFNRGALRVLEELTQAGSGTAWARALPDDSAAAFFFEDSALDRHLNFALGLDELASASPGAYGGVFELLREAPGLTRLSVAVTGYRDGLPDLLFGLWGDQDELRAVCTDLQIRLRGERDRELLAMALMAARAASPDDPPDSVAALEAANWLAHEPLLSRYPINRTTVGTADLTAADLTTPGYTGRYGTLDYSYLLPPRTDNDIRYLAEAGRDRPDTYLSDRFRLAFAFLDGVLWVATDSRELESLDSRLSDAGPSLDGSLPYRQVAAEWGREHKLQGFLNIDQIINLGLLTAESEIDDVLKGYLLDLENHPSVAISLEGRRDWLSIRFEILARSAMEAR